MRTIIGVLGLLTAGIVLPAVADEMPDILTHTYASSPAACALTDEGQSEANGLTVKDGAIWGTEFSCKFLTYTPVVWRKGEAPNQWVATTICGDDSGISRADLITISDYGDGSINLQSQNEYVEMLANGTWNEPGFVSQTYRQCPEQ